jgi:hypothetical protein
VEVLIEMVEVVQCGTEVLGGSGDSVSIERIAREAPDQPLGRSQVLDTLAGQLRVSGIERANVLVCYQPAKGRENDEGA